MEAGGEMRPFARAFRRWWWIIILATIVAGVIAFVVAYQGRPVYEATVRLLVGPITADGDTLDASSKLAATYAQLTGGQAVLSPTADQLGPALDDEYAWSAQSASADQSTRILSISVESDEAALAARIANLLAENLIVEVEGTTPRLEGNLSVIEPAVAPSHRIRPDPVRAAVAGALAALVGVLAVAGLVEAAGAMRRRRLHEPADAAAPTS